MNVKALAAVIAGIAPVVQEYVARSLDGVSARLKAIEERPLGVGPAGPAGEPGPSGVGEKGERGDPGVSPDAEEVARLAAALIPAPVNGKDGRDGVDGKDAEAPDVKAIAVRAAKLVPTPKDGRDGIDGKDADPEAIRAEVAKAVGAIPVPRDGNDADPPDLDAIARKAAELVPAPIDGRDGKDVDPEAVRAEVTKAVAALPVPRDGRDGAQGVPGRDGIGEKGIDGTDGRDGVDALGFDDIQVEHDGERGFVFKFVRGDQVKTFGAFRVPCQMYRGVYQVGKSYDVGDTVTWGGSQWTASAPTVAKPGESGPDSRAWTLSVQRGRDGKTGAKGERGEFVTVKADGRR